MARVEKHIRINDQAIRVTEPTMQDIWAFLQQSEIPEVDHLAIISGNKTMPPEILGLVTDLRPDDLGTMTPSEILEVIAAVQEVCRGFFEVATTLAKLRGILRSLASANSPTSSSTT